MQDNRNDGSQPYVLTIITHNPKYLDKFLIVLLETFLRDNRNEGSQPYVLTIITHNPKYLDQFLVLLETFQVGLVFAKHRVVTTHFNCLSKTSPVVKVSSKTIQNWSRYLRLCVPVADHGPRPCKISHKIALQRAQVV